MEKQNIIFLVVIIIFLVVMLYIIGVLLVAIINFQQPENQFCQENGFDDYLNKFCRTKNTEKQTITIEKRQIFCEHNMFYYEMLFFQPEKTDCYWVREAV